MTIHSYNEMNNSYRNLLSSIYSLSSGYNSQFNALSAIANDSITTSTAELSNINQGNSMLNIASNGLGQVSDLVIQQSNLVAQAASGSLTDSDRSVLNQQFQSLTAQIDQIASNTNYSGTNLLDGSFSKNIQGTQVNIGNASTAQLYKDNNGVTQTLDISTQAGATQAMSVLTDALNSVNTMQASIGATQSQLQYDAANLNVGINNQEASLSMLTETDIADSSMKFAQSVVQNNINLSVTAQMNKIQSNILNLLA